MGLFSKDIRTMEDLHRHVLRDVYYAEQKILKGLEDLSGKATNRALTAAVKAHRSETETQIARLEQVFELLGEKPKAVACPAIDGILKEAREIAGEVDDKAVLDAALIAATQAIQHYQITRYGTLVAWSKQLGNTAVAKLLATTLKEEKAADGKLSALAEKTVNAKAAR
jgi:ferritin-like metal-binding protein YciE